MFVYRHMFICVYMERAIKRDFIIIADCWHFNAMKNVNQPVLYEYNTRTQARILVWIIPMMRYDGMCECVWKRVKKFIKKFLL